jgi:membrane-associated protease RseP (regulator of RpoE activity)
VRVVTIDDLDLGLFQFDYDQTWCAVFLNADGTIYGRYGTRAAGGEKSATHISVASFRKTMQRALQLHKGYPSNKEQLTGKRGPKPEYRAPKDIPRVQRRHCIECHEVRGNVLRHKWKAKRLTAADIWPYPLPENLGLQMDVDDGLRVKTVAPDSPAARAGIAAGDELVTLDGQPLISQADIQWVLHRAPVETKVVAALKRGSKELRKTITLSGTWKESDLSWRASTGPGLRYGLSTVPLSDAEKKQAKLADDRLALMVKHMVAERTAGLRKAGLRVGDVIIAVDGKSHAMTESQFLAYVRLNHGPDDQVKLTVLRGKERVELAVPMW